MQKIYAESKLMVSHDQDEMSNLHRGHSINDSYQVSVVAIFVNRSGQN